MMERDLRASLGLLGGRTIEEMLLQEYASAGYVAVPLKCATRTFAIRSTEILGAPLETYRLTSLVVDGETDVDTGAAFPWRSMRIDVRVDDATVVERDGWVVDDATAGSPVLADGQTFIDAGPVGSAPPAAVKGERHVRHHVASGAAGQGDSRLSQRLSRVTRGQQRSSGDRLLRSPLHGGSNRVTGRRDCRSIQEKSKRRACRERTRTATEMHH
jgi:hypothetical protein